MPHWVIDEFRSILLPSICLCQFGFVTQEKSLSIGSRVLILHLDSGVNLQNLDGYVSSLIPMNVSFLFGGHYNPILIKITYASRRHQESDREAVKEERRPAACAGRISPNVDIAAADLSLNMPTWPSVNMDPSFRVLSPNLLPTWKPNKNS